MKISEEKLKKLLLLKKKLKKEKIEETKPILNKKERVKNFIDSELKRRKEEKILHKEEKKERIEKSKLEKNVREVLLKVITDYENDMSNLLENKFEKMLSKMQVSGIAYKAYYKSLTFKEIDLKVMNDLGNKGWKFCFELDNKFYFMKERFLKKENE